MVNDGTMNLVIGTWEDIKRNDSQNNRVHFRSFVLSSLWFILYGCVVRYFYLRCHRLVHGFMEEEISYLAGLFDGEGTVMYKKYWEYKRSKKKKYNCWRISMEVAMTDKPTVAHILKTLKIGTVLRKPRKGGHMLQWKWRCSHRQAYHVAKLFLPYAITKRSKLKQIVNHYTKEEA